MIRKIQSSEYLKRYDDMTAAERAEYESRVGDWLSVDGQSLVKRCETFEARLQNVLQAGAGWNDAECQAFEDGAVLLSALVGTADTWLPDMLYIKSAKRAVKTMFELLWSAEAGHTDLTDHTDKNAAPKPKEEPARGKAASKQEQGDARIDTAEREQTRPEVNGKATQAVGGKAADKDLTKDSVRMQAGEAKDNAYTVETGGAASVSPDAKPTDTTQANPEIRQVSVELPVPVRPKHVDQYVHLLPEKTQEHAAQLQGLYRELDETRRKMDLLMDDKTAKDDDRAAWAKKATAIDNKIRKILDELDAGWEKLVKEGRVVVDDLGNARVIAPVQTAPTPPRSAMPLATSKNSGGEAAALDDNAQSGGEAAAEMTSEQKARRRSIRKWLVDIRRGNGDEENRADHVIKWKENFEELWKYDGDKVFEDDKVMAAAAHYGIDLEGVKERRSNSEGKETTD